MKTIDIYPIHLLKAMPLLTSPMVARFQNGLGPMTAFSPVADKRHPRVVWLFWHAQASMVDTFIRICMALVGAKYFLLDMMISSDSSHYRSCESTCAVTD